MKYIVSDIHGCYGQYLALLDKIHFSGEDELYVLGDVVDRGPEPIKTLQDMMRRPNVVFILGNHDFIMYSLMKTLAVEITEENWGEPPDKGSHAGSQSVAAGWRTDHDGEISQAAARRDDGYPRLHSEGVPV